MEKGALLPIRFYPATTWQDWQKIKDFNYNVAVVREHYIYVPAFQMTLPDVGMHWVLSDFSTIEVVDQDGTTTDISGGILQTYNSAGEFRALVQFRFPYTHVTAGAFDTGLYYVHVSDGQTDWYSEVFELCNLGLDAFSAGFDNESNFAFFDDNNYDSDDEWAAIGFFCKTTAAGRAEAYTEVDVFLGEELDLYVNSFDYSGPACGATDWNDSVYFELRDSTGLVVSNTVEVDAAGDYSFTITAEAGGTLRFYMYIEDNDTTKGGLYCFLQHRYAEDNMQLRWSHDKNFCKIFYETEDNVDYENVIFLDTKQVINENAIEETVIEDDETNKYPIIGTNKKWNSLKFAGGEALLNAMSLLRLHKNISFYRELGEPMHVDEINLEQSVIDYEAAQVNLVYREVSCSVEACGFDTCCPTEDLPMMEFVTYGGIGILPAAAGWSGKYCLVEVPADEFQVYQSNGAAWGSLAVWRVAGNCLEIRQNFNDIDFTPGRDAIRFFWYDSGTICWRAFCELESVADNADGTANVVTDTEYVNGVYLEAQYATPADKHIESDWITCCMPDGPTTSGAGAITLICTCGAGTWDFRIHVFTDDCDYGYTEWRQQTIT